MCTRGLERTQTTLVMSFTEYLHCMSSFRHTIPCTHPTRLYYLFLSLPAIHAQSINLPCCLVNSSFRFYLFSPLISSSIANGILSSLLYTTKRAIPVLSVRVYNTTNIPTCAPNDIIPITTHSGSFSVRTKDEQMMNPSMLLN